ncbi:hypothetical protein [Rhodococcus sp. PD04]|uniref:hypothetical protein n=1 Tax=Rhodococcus sp. PD04 TaxID=3109594 RepID=UPI002DDBC037|nr:hypothetical protein [Rhodococcus sp. PD04]WSE22342.1 hypothetical protein U9J23_22255 [Rhodococcus sp. PD04]
MTSREDELESGSFTVETAIGRAGGFYVAPAGTPLPTDVDSALEGFEPVGMISREPEFGADPETLREFAEQSSGRPYVWPRQNGKNSIFARFGEVLDVLAEGLRPIVEQFTTTFRVLEANWPSWAALFGDLPPAGRSSRSLRRRKNRLRRKRIARKRRRG